MFSERLKKLLTTACITIALILSAGVAGNSNALAQGRYNRDRHSWDRHREHDELERIRRFDRDRRLRYRMHNSIRTVGYYDRFGRFHAYGFYDRFGRFHRY